MNQYRKLEMQVKTNSRKEDYKYFVGSTLKNPLEYKKGEKMVFKIRVKYMDDYLDIPYIYYKVTSDDNQNYEGYMPKADDGWFYIETSISKSGFVHLQAKACDDEKQIIEGIAVYNGGVGADVENILNSTPAPVDYFKFWEKLKLEVMKTEPEVLFCERVYDENYKGFEMYDMRLKVPESDYASLMVAYPENAEKKSLKFAMFFQGYGVYPTEAKPLDDYLTVHVNAHSIPNRGTDEFFANIRDNVLKGYGYSLKENKKPETTYWAKLFMRNLQVLRYFENHELLNGQDYHFIGSSQGGMQACNMAAHFEKATAAILNVPWLADIYGHENAGRRENGMPKGFGITYFDSAVAAEHLKCPVYIISGLGDTTCNTSTQMALYNAIKSPKYIEFYQNKVHSFTIPWDNLKYTLGDVSLSGQFKEHTAAYYDFN